MNPIKSSLIHRIAPFDEKRAGKLPALILLHGRGADELDLLDLSRHLDPRFFVVSVRAPFRFPAGGYTWYTVLEVGSPEPKEFATSYDLLVQFLADVKRHYPIDTGRVFLMGFSMGTMMAFALALTKPGEIRGVVAHSGYIPEGTHLQFRLDELAHTSFLIAHGTLDPVIPVQWGRRANEILRSTNADLTYREYPIGHQISEESLNDMKPWFQSRIDGMHD